MADAQEQRRVPDVPKAEGVAPMDAVVDDLSQLHSMIAQMLAVGTVPSRPDGVVPKEAEVAPAWMTARADVLKSLMPLIAMGMAAEFSRESEGGELPADAGSPLPPEAP